MTSELSTELLQEVLVHPNDLEPRERCAAWLEAHGDPWGEYIRLALAEARSPGRYSPDWNRHDELEKLHGNRWSAAIRSLVDDVLFSRGFVEYVVVSAQGFLDRAERIFATAPVRHLQVHDLAPIADEFFSSSYLERLVSLIPDDRMGERGIRLLASSPHLRNLRYLSVPFGLTADGLEALAASPHLGNLELLRADTEPSIKEYYERDEYLQELIVGAPITPSPFAKELEARYGYKAWLHPVERFRNSTPTWAWF